MNILERHNSTPFDAPGSRVLFERLLTYLLGKQDVFHVAQGMSSVKRKEHSSWCIAFSSKGS
jgi:hypothetical protein